MALEELIERLASTGLTEEEAKDLLFCAMMEALDNPEYEPA